MRALELLQKKLWKLTILFFAMALGVSLVRCWQIEVHDTGYGRAFQQMNAPGFKIPAGSQRAFKARISGRAEG